MLFRSPNKNTTNLLIQQNKQQQGGSSLLEVLVTIIVLSLGILSISGLIMTTMKYGHGSYNRSQASWLTNDIVDRMRANRTVAETAPSSYNLAMTNPTPPSSSTEIAKQDLANWRAQLAATLPSGNGSINVDSTTLKVTVVIQWVDNRTNMNPGIQTFTTETLL